jgi:uncharacterized protein YecA (UPF0149 family)
MDLDTGEIHRFERSELYEKWKKEHDKKLFPLTEEQAKELQPLSNRRRKALLGGMPCPCASGKSFKKCCWKKYKRGMTNGN